MRCHPNQSIASIAFFLTMSLVLETLSETHAAQVNSPEPPKWIRAHTKFANGGETSVWFSPKRKIWIRMNDRNFLTISDAGEKTKYFFSQDRKRVMKWPLGNENCDPVFPLSQVTAENQYLGGWFFTMQQIVNQNRLEVVEDVRTWVEIQFGLVGGRFFEATLRVDPDSKRPLYFLTSIPGSVDKPVRWDFDYPDDDPVELDLLKPEQNAIITDMRPSKDCQLVLDAISASRAQIGDFRLVVADPGEFQTINVVFRKGDLWRIDQYSTPDHNRDAAKSVETKGWSEWIESTLKFCKKNKSLVCDANSVFNLDWKDFEWGLSETNSPLDLMSCFGSNLLGITSIPGVLFPDLFPEPMGTFQFAPQPSGPRNLVVIKQSRESTGPAEVRISHSWNYFDATKGHLRVRGEYYYLPKGKSPNPDSVPDRVDDMEEIIKSPQGWWYPRVIRHTNRAEGKEYVTITRYEFDFDTELPDSLFRTDDLEK